MSSSPNERGVTVISCEAPPFPGGIGTYAGRMVENLRANGVDTLFIAPRYDTLPQGDPDPHCARILRHHKIPLGAVPRILALFRGRPKQYPILAADIRTVLFTYVTRMVHRRAYRAMVHGSEVSKFKQGTFLARLVGRAYLAADVVLFNSNATRDLFEQAFGPTPRGRVSYLGVEETWFAGGEGPFQQAGLAALPEAARIICSVGRIEPRKGQLEGVRIVAAARDVHGIQDLVYVIAGRPEDDAYAAEVVAEAERLSVPLVLAGRVEEEDLKRLYRRALCHLLFARALPGKIEGFGLVLLEAAAQGCPSISTRVGGIPEVVADTGPLVRDGDVDAAAAALAELAAAPQRRDGLGKAAQERARTFTWRSCAKDSFPEYFEQHSSVACRSPLERALAKG